MNEVVITGCGVVSPIGANVEEFSANMFAGRSGVRGIRGNFADENFPVPYAAVIDREKLPTPRSFDKQEKWTLPKSWLFSALALEEALQGLAPGSEIDALVYGTADGLSWDLVKDSLLDFDPKNYNWDVLRSESPLLTMTRILQSLGYNDLPEDRQLSLNSACATGNQTIGVAFERIRSGEWSRCLAGGVDARCELSNLMNFHMLGALCVDEVAPETASRPFAADRTGFVRGEAAAVLLLESRKVAEARGAKILAKVTGYAFTSDAYRLTDGREDCISVKRAMQQAISSAKLKPEDIDYINAHGTSTLLNDRLECKAINELFASHATKLAVSSLKSQIGHSTIASGAVEAVASVCMLLAQRLAPTINYHHKDPECALDFVPNESREAKIKNILSNSFGFGGQNACLLFQAEEKR